MPQLTRQQILLAAAVGVVVLWVAIFMVGPAALAPFQQKAEDLKKVTASVEQKTKDAAAVEKAKTQLVAWRARSLPPDVGAAKSKRSDALDAQRKYQEWITDLTILAGFDSPKVRPLASRQISRTFSGASVNAAVSVAVSVEAHITYGQLATFLDHFYRAELLHRISKLRVESRESSGDPELHVWIDCEGLAINDAKVRRTLFPETTLTAELSADAKSCRVAGSDGFPKQVPFRVRIGGEYLTVTAIKGDEWTIVRAVERTHAAEHPSGGKVELTPLNPAFPSKTADEFHDVLLANVFIKPPPPKEYKPRFDPLNELAFVRGKSFEFTVAVKDYDPTQGKPAFAITAGAPPGLQIDIRTGKIQWKPAEDQPTGKFPLSIEARHPSAEDGRLQGKLTVVFREPNSTPQIKVVPPPVAYLGRQWKYKLDVTDPETPLEKLKIKLDGAPEGLSVAMPAGELVWTPPESLKPGDFSVKVEVTDDGTPAQTVTATVPLKLQDDAASFTKLTGIVARDEQWEAMLTDQLQDKALIVHVGDTLNIADVSGTITDIKPKFVLVKQGEQTMRLDLGDNLRSLQPAGEG
jgi:hypothetical protein